MKVMLVDDHLLFLESLTYLLKTFEIEVVGQASDGREALVKAKVLKPEIILMDIRMPEFSGLDVLKLIKAELPKTKVIMLTSSEEDEDLFEAVKYGASGYLLKNTDAKKLIEYLTNVENDEVPLSPELASRILKEFRNENDKEIDLQKKSDDCPLMQKLTERQLEVLEIIAQGKTYKEAGDRLGLTERTIKYHMGRILELLHVENRAQAISYAAQNGLLQDK